MTPTPVVTFYFDPVSPYAWLATKAIARIEAAGAQVVFQPVLFAALLNAHGNKGPAEIPSKRQYIFRDVMREAAREGLAFKGPPGHPFNPLQAMRMCLALTRQDERRNFAIAVMKACWEQGEDVSDAAVLLRVAASCGLSGTALQSAVQQPAIKMQLAADTEKAITDGVFGVPSGSGTSCSGAPTASRRCCATCTDSASTSARSPISWRVRPSRNGSARLLRFPRTAAG